MGVAFLCSHHTEKTGPDDVGEAFVNRAFGPSKLDGKPAPRLGREWRYLSSKQSCNELDVYLSSRKDKHGDEWGGRQAQKVRGTAVRLSPSSAVQPPPPLPGVDGPAGAAMARFFCGVAGTVFDAIGFFSSLHSSSLELLRKVALASISSSSERLRFLLVTTIFGAASEMGKDVC